MAEYSIRIGKQVRRRDLTKIPDKDFLKINQSIAALADRPRPQGAEKLTARGGYRVRQGDYRILYEIDDSKRMVSVKHVSHRREVYR